MHAVNIIAIGYAKRSLEIGSRDEIRVHSYAEQFNAYHQIVFTRKGEYPALQHDGKLLLYATNSVSKLTMMFDAYRIAQSIITASPRERWVVTAQDPFAAGVVMFFLKAKYIARQVQVHGDIFAKRYFSRTFLTWPLRVWALFLFNRVEGIRVVSKRIATSLERRKIASEKIAIQAIQPRLDKFLEVGAQRLYGPKESLNFIYVGRFTKEKNLPMLLKAFALAFPDNQKITLTLVGDGPKKGSLEQLVVKLKIQDRIVFSQWTDDVSGALANADVLCLASNHEGYALVLLEAMAAGMAVITTAVGCAGEVVQDGIHGRVVPVGSVKQFSEAMRVLSENDELREQCGRKGYKSATEQIVSNRVYVEELCNTLAMLAK